MNYDNGPRGPVFKAMFSAQAVTTNPYDMFGFLSSNSGMELMDLSLTQASSLPTNNQTIGVQFFRGSTADSTSGAITPINVLGWGNVPSPTVAVTLPSSTIVSTTSAVVVHAECFNILDGFRYRTAERADRLCLSSSQRLHVRITAPSTAMTFYGTATFRQIPRTST